MDIDDDQKGLARLDAAERYAWTELERTLAALDESRRGGRTPSEIGRLLTDADAAHARWRELSRAKQTYASHAVERIRAKLTEIPDGPVRWEAGKPTPER